MNDYYFTTEEGRKRCGLLIFWGKRMGAFISCSWKGIKRKVLKRGLLLRQGKTVKGRKGTNDFLLSRGRKGGRSPLPSLERVGKG